jgi:GPH family glycoside/pentoside/hexuronide:cation symporter
LPSLPTDAKIPGGEAGSDRREETVVPQEKLSAGAKWFYGSGDTGFSLTTTLIGAYLAIFLTDIVGIPAGIAAAAIFIGKSWDYINDPIVGYISDRTRSRWGRRRPFLLFGPLPFGLAFILLWLRPPLTGHIALAAYYACAYLLFETAATFVYMPYFALTPELTSDYDERTSLTTHRMFFSIFASLLAFGLPPMFIDFVPENANRVLIMGVIFAVLSAVPLYLVFFTTKEREEYSEPEPPKLVESLKAAFKNPPFLFSLGIYLFTWLAIDVMQTTLMYFIKHVMKREAQDWIIMGTIFIVAILALPIWNKASKMWGKRKAYIGGIAFWAVVQLIIVSLQPSTPLALLLVLCALAGVGVAAAHVLPWSIIPDSIEWDEWRSGKRHEGMYYSLVTLIRKIVSSVAIPGALLLLEVTGYEEVSAAQPGSAVLAIRMLTGPIPSVFLLAAIAIAVRYPLSREQFSEITAALEKRRAGGTS